LDFIRPFEIPLHGREPLNEAANRHVGGGPDVETCEAELSFDDRHPGFHATHLVAEIGHDLVRDPDEAIDRFLRRGDEDNPADGMSCSLEDLLPEGLEGRLDTLPRPRARQDGRTRVLLTEEVEVVFCPDPVRDEVRLVPAITIGTRPASRHTAGIQ